MQYDWPRVLNEISEDKSTHRDYVHVPKYAKSSPSYIRPYTAQDRTMQRCMVDAGLTGAEQSAKALGKPNRGGAPTAQHDVSVWRHFLVLGQAVATLATFLLSFFASAQFQSLLRSSFKGLGVWIIAHTNADPNQLDTLIGAFMALYGVLMSAVAHSSQASPVIGASAGANPTPQPYPAPLSQGEPAPPSKQGLTP